jgi:hypothetical protein
MVVHVFDNDLCILNRRRAFRRAIWVLLFLVENRRDPRAFDLALNKSNAVRHVSQNLVVYRCVGIPERDLDGGTLDLQFVAVNPYARMNRPGLVEAPTLEKMEP